MDKPIFSTRADEPGLSHAIDEFVVNLAERIDALQDAERTGDLERLAADLQRLASQADALGFGALASAASQLEGVRESTDPQETRKHLIEVTHVATRIRLGHRGAV